MNRSRLFPRAALQYAFQARRRAADPAQRPGRGSLVGVSFGYTPSLHCLRRVKPFVRQFLRYFGCIRLLTGVDDGLAAAGSSPPRPRMLLRSPMRPPSFCARDFPTCSGSATAWDRRMTCDYRHAACCLPPRLTTSASQIPDFAAQWLACRFPLSTLRQLPRGRHRMTRGRNDSPFPFRIELSSTISCQLCWRTNRPARITLI